MRVIVAITFLLSCVLIMSNAQQPLIFPYPASVESGSGEMVVLPSTFTITTSSPSSILKSAIDRYMSLLFPFPVNTNRKQKARAPAPELPTLDITVESSNETLQFGIDESYTLVVDDATQQATITAKTIYGAMYGLETFSQLVVFDEPTNQYQIQYTPYNIQDSPRFPWRGLMIDTARHYLFKSTILRTIEAMSYNKLNTLHWHIVDAQSFPIVSSSYPELSEFGAYSPSYVYTGEDVEEIVQYAQQYGVRVVPEFDIPGHAASWGNAFSNLTAKCPGMSSNINNIALNPSIDFTYEVLSGVITEMASKFQDTYFHTGGDEVEFGCWDEDENIMAWAKQNGLNSGPAIEEYFETKLQAIVKGTGKTMMCWQELFNNGVTLSPETIVEVWKDVETLQEVVSAGHRAIVAFPYYLDKQIPSTYNPPNTHYEWIDTWTDFWSYDPSSNLTGGEEYVIGGEACMFSEAVDSVNYDSRVWPRASGVAERLWSAQTLGDVNEARTRLIQFRCHSMAQRDIGAGPAQVDYCPLPPTSRFI